MSAMPAHNRRPGGASGTAGQCQATPVPSQLLFREVNEQISLRRSSFQPPHEQVEFVCECERRGCTQALLLSREEYEAVRQFPTRFVMKRGHPRTEVERVVAEYERYVVVEKTGPAARVAIRLDPRRAARELVSAA